MTNLAFFLFIEAFPLFCTLPYLSGLHYEHQYKNLVLCFETAENKNKVKKPFPCWIENKNKNIKTLPTLPFLFKSIVLEPEHFLDGLTTLIMNR